MNMKVLTTKTKAAIAVDLTKLLKPYTSGWVVLSKDQRRVVGAGDTLQEAHDKALDKGVPNGVFVKVIPPNQGYLPAFL